MAILLISTGAPPPVCLKELLVAILIRSELQSVAIPHLTVETER